jgi:hypothetical protein
MEVNLPAFTNLALLPVDGGEGSTLGTDSWFPPKREPTRQTEYDPFNLKDTDNRNKPGLYRTRYPVTLHVATGDRAVPTYVLPEFIKQLFVFIRM